MHLEGYRHLWQWVAWDGCRLGRSRGGVHLVGMGWLRGGDARSSHMRVGVGAAVTAVLGAWLHSPDSGW